LPKRIYYGNEKRRKHPLQTVNRLQRQDYASKTSRAPSKNEIIILPVSSVNKLNPKKRVVNWRIRYVVSLDILFANAKAIGISIIASAIAKAQETFATMFVTPENVAKIAPAPIIKKML
jgi:hypothetical protein